MTEEATTHFGFNNIPVAEKVVRVRHVFDSVSKRYDLMNDLMSLGIHRLWKRYAVHKMRLQPNQRLLDVASGTGDLARLMMRRMDDRGQVVLCDINGSMLQQGRHKMTNIGMVAGMTWVQGNAESLPFPDHCFHAVTIGFGIRNVTHMEQAITEMVRVLRPGGQFLCLEFSQLAIPWLQPLYDVYSFKVLPEIGQWVARDRAAYQYLVESIRRFPNQQQFSTLLSKNGLGQVRYDNLSAGIAAIHTGYKV
ncbi:MAG: bifunctional demethylmenaquinone methyltransferase/2-methoxy-6-polyprenyl-1,4-benzoquinol methylase UbiE [Magnetococcales bacterium]|nr:bifunctional demethylmenaquinone methyltransferase/2-methoxy-6-polyprenyl-1,4-benzoquinol methylase UbiE [Magnetococcales bacterium]